ncbi:hypothetical protein PflSS101_2727 [Pseudomonas lactis]|uniref:Uncharacterized protein n=1 Tax=Pseudomonas lactis TaxID=1615674 RepID=I4K6L9_9PSED|nr:hypothetical protein PflSS101_2727 [Pseudomonas lactis]
MRRVTKLQASNNVTSTLNSLTSSQEQRFTPAASDTAAACERVRLMPEVAS